MTNSIVEISVGKDNQGLNGVRFEFTDETSMSFTVEIDTVTNRRKNFRNADGSIFARTTKSLKSKMGMEVGSNSGCLLNSLMNKKWGYSN